MACRRGIPPSPRATSMRRAWFSRYHEPMSMTSQPRRRTLRFVVMTVLCALVFLTGRGTAVAHPGHDHKVMGVIVAIDGAHVTIKTNDGKERTFEVVAATAFLRGKQKGAKDDL